MNEISYNSAERDRARQFLYLIVLVSFVVRLLTTLITYKHLLTPADDYFSYGWEVGRVGRALASGHGYSSPYQGDSGPTAALPPLYPLIVGAIFKLFGIYSVASEFVILITQGITSALTCIPMFFLARRTFGERAAKIACWIWAFFPYAIAISASYIWSTSLSALMLAWLLWLVFHLAEGAGWRSWLELGVLVGLIGLNNPTILPLVVVLVLWVWARRAQGLRTAVVQSVVAAAIAFLFITPWIVRNYRAFGRFIPMRSNLGLHLHVGNTLDTSEFWHSELDPPHSPRELQEFLRVGEIAYMDRQRKVAFTFIREHPGVYVWLCFKRVVKFWTGIWGLSPEYLKANLRESLNIPLCTAISVLAFLGLRRAFQIDRHVAWAYALCLIVYPAVYYLTTYELAYHHPLDPILLILTAAAFVPAARAKVRLATQP
jgi:4-amino-4-deoxy-L-arabinose transferase-like glycosyltransferase